jgi:hypothetical protein
MFWVFETKKKPKEGFSPQPKQVHTASKFLVFYDGNLFLRPNV